LLLVEQQKGVNGGFRIKIILKTLQFIAVNCIEYQRNLELKIITKLNTYDDNEG
jgi:hypothetical protein